MDEQRINEIVNAYLASLDGGESFFSEAESEHESPEIDDVRRMLQKDLAKGIDATSRAEISNYVKEAMFRKLISKHRWINNKPPLGYRVDADGYLKVCKKEIAIVRWIFKKYLEIRNLPEVRFLLEKEKKISKSTHSLWYIIRNSIYLGIYNVSGEVAYLPELQVIDEKMFLNVQRLLSEKKPREQMPEDRKLRAINNVFSQYMRNLENESRFEREPKLIKRRNVTLNRRVKTCGYESDFLDKI